MTKARLAEILNEYDDDEEIDLNQIERDEWEARQEFIESIEERQHQSGFYAFQDLMDLRRRER